MPEPINPVTFTSRDGKTKLSLGRLHIGSTNRSQVPDGMNRLQGPEQIEKHLSCVVWQDKGGEIKTLAEFVVDEDHFIRGIQHLFPKGELNLSD